jgi:tRNA threonylcarbamoyladenosine biosynthesis protein TsaB
MKILAVDTSTRTCSVALVDNDRLIAETTIGIRQTHSKHLMDIIAQLIAAAKLDIDAVDGLAVVNGPGSFTGLRIGVSTIKGMATATGMPVCGVSALEALAWQCQAYNGRIYAMIDARKAEVYAAGYLAADGELTQQMAAQVDSPDNILKKMKKPCLCIGTGALLYKDLIETHLGPEVQFVPALQNHVQASTVAFLARQIFERGRVDRGDPVTPQYLRKSDAQINLPR